MRKEIGSESMTSDTQEIREKIYKTAEIRGKLDEFIFGGNRMIHCQHNEKYISYITQSNIQICVRCVQEQAISEGMELGRSLERPELMGKIKKELGLRRRWLQTTKDVWVIKDEDLQDILTKLEVKE